VVVFYLPLHFSNLQVPHPLKTPQDYLGLLGQVELMSLVIANAMIIIKTQVEVRFIGRSVKQKICGGSIPLVMLLQQLIAARALKVKFNQKEEVISPFFLFVMFFKTLQKKAIFLALFLNTLCCYSQHLVTILVVDEFKQPIEHCQLTSKNLVAYTNAQGNVNLELELNDSVYIRSFGYKDTTVLFTSWPKKITIPLKAKNYVLDELTLFPSTERSKKITIAKKNKLFQRESSDIRLVAFKEVEVRIDSILIIVKETMKEGAAFRGVIYKGSHEIFFGPIVVLPNEYAGEFTLPMSYYLTHQDSIYIGIEFINVLEIDPKNRNGAHYRINKKGLFSTKNNGATLAGSKKKKRSEEWISVTYRRNKKTVRAVSSSSVFFAAPYMEIYFTEAR